MDERIENFEEFKILQKRYENMTLEKIKLKWLKDGEETLRMLTGFGIMSLCTLCNRVDSMCDYCVWSHDSIIKKKLNGEAYCVATKWYKKIQRSRTPEGLYYAVQSRAKYMKKIIIKIIKINLKHT